MRLQINDEIIVFNNITQHTDYKAVIINNHKNNINIKIIDKYLNNTESPVNIHLGQALIKPDKMDWAIQKAVELGVSEITPLITQHCAVNIKPGILAKKIVHWNSIIISACEQSGRGIIPVLHPVKLFSDWIVEKYIKLDNIKIILEPDIKKSKNNKIIKLLDLKNNNNSKNIIITTGPEGGFHQDEIEWAKQHGFDCVQMGPRILRAETAAVVGLTGLQMCFGDF